MIQQIDQARIAFHELDNQGNDALQDFLQAHFPDHESADLLKEAQLLLGTLETHLKLSGFGHYFYYKAAAKKRPQPLPLPSRLGRTLKIWPGMSRARA